MSLIHDRNMEYLVHETYKACKEELQKPKATMVNHVQDIYKPFTVKEINEKLVEMLRPHDMVAPVEIVFQSLEGLHKAIPHNEGDWYFSGNYPTPGGTRLCNQAFVNYVEQSFEKKPY